MPKTRGALGHTSPPKRFPPTLDINEWQISGINKALSSLAAGKGIPHERVSQWVASWETRKERPPPRSV